MRNAKWIKNVKIEMKREYKTNVVHISIRKKQNNIYSLLFHSPSSKKYLCSAINIYGLRPLSSLCMCNPICMCKGHLFKRIIKIYYQHWTLSVEPPPDGGITSPLCVCKLWLCSMICNTEQVIRKQLLNYIFKLLI